MLPYFNPQAPCPQPSNGLPAQQNNGMTPNLQQQLHGLNQQFQQPIMHGAVGQNAHIANFQGNTLGMLSQPPGFSGVPNGQFMMQNGILNNMNSHPQGLNPLQAMVLQGQLLNALQNLSQLSAMQFQGQLNMNGIWPHSLAQSMNQVAGLIPQNPMLMMNNSMSTQSMQNNLGFVQGICNDVTSSRSLMATSSLGGTVLSSDSTQSSFDRQRRSTGPIATNWNNESVTQISGHPNSSQLTQLQATQMASQHGHFQHTQFTGNTGNIGNDISQFNSGNSSYQSITRNPPELWKRDQSRNRCQKPQFSHNSNPEENFRPITGNKGKGPQNKRERHPQLPNFIQNPHVIKRRLLCVNYTEQEIQLWREARRRNYPTAAKKIGRNDGNNAVIDGDTKLRRQQLKEILAKQAELGVEVAELPPNYLSESESKASTDVNKTSYNRNDRFQNKFIDKGRRVNRHPKRRNLRNISAALCAPLKREPTLLQKLLHAEIKRDKSKLLQVFRFVTLNSFFKDWPAKPLEFPQVTLKDAVHGEGAINDNGCDLINGTLISDGKEDFELDAEDNEVGAEEGINEDGDTSSGSGDLEKENLLCEEADKSEEGEIT